MNEKLLQIKNRILDFWNGRTNIQKVLMIGSFVFVIALIIIVTTYASRPNLVPLYTNLTAQETGQIKEQLDTKGIKSEIRDNGTTIYVPESQADVLMVELAAEGIPNSGNIDYSFFGQNAGFGMTDNEFRVMETAAIQTELAKLISGIDGIENANVMISQPEENVFLSSDEQTATASVVIKQEQGYRFTSEQIQSLYHLVSKSVPNLPTENIVIMNQMFEYFEPENSNNTPSVGETYVQQQSIKEDIEKDLQREVQKMLGTIMGYDKVVVSVTTDVDFTKENREENIVQPVSEDLESIAVSVEKIEETYTGNGAVVGGEVGTGQGDIPNVAEIDDEDNGNYERTEERINSDFNRIRKEISESPYKIRDLGIQVMVEPPNPDDDTSLPQERIDDIQQLLTTMVRTTVDDDFVAQMSDEELDSKVFVSVQKFNGKVEFQPEGVAIPTWVYIAAGILFTLLVIAIVLIMRRRRLNQSEVEEELPVFEELPDLSQEPETEGMARRKQLEKLAKEKPDEFAKLLRSWLADD
ncbi:flagellar basal-body MS-ring/collar protein FliF [Bacillus solimangrovi]|uniref:Flagellar M-ring protein n=1 Tax=Bacillus solimangrovi TaxID=1305675 RepID=A0A1E5LB02_9BACI|nr:flagellar basal-body MS-ring/collar protein FliF [Bacillus solimangrovi]OEH91258.1 flagellar M-ring protein FliF [Bacillus solimangrovi]